MAKQAEMPAAATMALWDAQAAAVCGHPSLANRTPLCPRSRAGGHQPHAMKNSKSLSRSASAYGLPGRWLPRRPFRTQPHPNASIAL